MNIKHLVIFALSFLSLTAAHAAAPANDSILKAFKLSGNYSANPAQDLSLGTADPMDPMLGGASAGKTLWYAFPYHPATGTLGFTITSTTAIGTVSIFYPQDPENPRGSLRQLSSTALAAGQTLNVSTSFDGGPVYLMLAGTGQCSVTHRLYDASFDFPASPYPLSGDSGSASVDNLRATNTADEPALPAGSVAMSNIVWFKYTPNFSGSVYFDTNFSFSSGESQFSQSNPPPLHDTQIAIYASTSGGTADALAPLVSNDNGGYGYRNSRVTTIVFSSTTYYIAVGTVSGASGSIHLQHYRSTTPSEIYFVNTDLGNSSEGSGTHPVYVRRRYAYSGADSCTLTTSNGTATAGSDYTSLTTTVNFAAPSADTGAWQVSAPVALIQDSIAEAKYETINVTLSSPSSGSVITSDTAYFYIWDDETGDDPSITLSVESVRIRESDAPLAIQAQRQYLGDTTYIDLIQTKTGGTASYPQDFTFIDQRITSAQSVATIYFVPEDDNVFEGDETVTVSVTGAYNESYTVVIEDDDLYVPTPGKLTTSLTYAGGKRRAVLYSTVSPLGAVSGKLTIVGQTLPFTGKLDDRGKLKVALAPKGRGIFYLTLAAQDSQGHIKAELLDSTTNGLSSDIALVQNYAPVINPCPLAGSYTVRGGTINDGTNTIQCAGAASCKIDVKGNAVFVGKLFDGTAHTIAGYVDGEAQVAAIAMLYAGQGFVGYTGEIPLVAGSTTSLTVSLNRPARANDPLKLGAIASYFGGICARYTPPLAGARVIEAWAAGTGKATLSGAPMPMMLTKALTISTTNVIAAPADTLKLKLAVVPATGMFSGSFVLPGTTKVMKIFGALTDLPGLNGFGSGYFFDGKQGGQIDIGKP